MRRPSPWRSPARNLLHLAAEGDRFDAGLGLVKFREPLPLASASDVFLKPVSNLWGHTGTPSAEARGLFFGGPFALLCLAGLVWLWRTHLDLALGVAISAVLLFTPLLPLTMVSRYHFRDPMLLSAIPFAAVTADTLRRSPRGWLPVIVLLVAQCAAVVGEATPFLQLVWGARS